jgi:hypothetical protein
LGHPCRAIAADPVNTKSNNDYSCRKEDGVTAWLDRWGNQWARSC